MRCQFLHSWTLRVVDKVMIRGLATPRDMIAASSHVLSSMIMMSFYLFLQKQKSAQSYIPQGYFPPYEAV
jgi:hypothetical protein